MLEIRGEADLLKEPFGAKHGCELGVQYLDGDTPVVLAVVREIDGGHATRAELALEHEASAECSLKLIAQLIGHG